MAKKIDIAGHIKRYEDTDITFISALIQGLTELIEKRKVDAIAFHEQQLEILKTGKIPEPAPIAEKKERTNKKKSISQSTESA